jgi:MFS transporter, DHA1 family, tetracycline resistance protein
MAMGGIAYICDSTFVMQQNRKAAIGFIFITLLIDVTGFGLIIPVFPKMIAGMIGGDISDASQMGGVLMAAYAAVQFLFAPLVGNLSDQYGRRPILLCSLFGFGVDYIFLCFAPTIEWLFVGRIVAGIFGASFSTATAYIADISNNENRAKNFGMIGAAFGVGFVLGPVLGGLLGQIHLKLPFYVAAGFCFLNWLYGFFILPESLQPENRRPLNWRKANPIGVFRNLKNYASILGLIVAYAFLSLAAHAVQSNWNYYTIHKFNWNELTVGLSLALVGLLVGGVQAGLTRVVNPILGNKKSIYIGFSLAVVGLVLFAFASSTWMMFVFLVPYCLSGIAMPALQSLISGGVPPNEQGLLQGALTSIQSGAAIVGPLAMTSLFKHFSAKNGAVYFPGAPFILGALLTSISLVAVYLTLSKKSKVAA